MGQAEHVSNIGKHMARIAGLISADGFPAGERAALRRMSPGKPPPLVFYSFAVRHLPEGWEDAVHDWMTLVAGMAVMAPNSFSPRVGLGKALALANFSELRLERLLAATGATRRTLLLRGARFLGSQNMPFNWTDAALLLLTRDPEKMESVRMRIAKDFYTSRASTE